ncbi:AAA family ATPase [Chryseobacterium scophthalmum]|uniref:AAA domain-containing protein n=1 Tax=Chryseobacterium scophthalmum TaxID=59733 RepID=A0A1N6IA50_9FLAO|nr:AAA family ATPase [Chryseobacterium scophthalmum]SIO28880.1 AAA domain-containing protein [Chryseobacterium scophthalmum]
MSQTLTEIAQKLIDTNKKVQLIYAFNGIGKTRLSREVKELIAPKSPETEEDTGIKIMYYNAFTEDLFYWDNDLTGDVDRKLLVRPNAYTDLALSFLKDENQDGNIIINFQHYATSSITPIFNDDFTEITFSYFSGGDNSEPNIKISKGEESNFIWCIFYSLIEQITKLLNDKEEDRSTDKFNELEYIFIDDPVSSLDDNNLIELAVAIAKLVKTSESNKLKFIITTHNPLFYNVISNELNNKQANKNPEIVTNSGVMKRWIYEENQSIKYKLKKQNDGRYNLIQLDRKTPFSYHLHLLLELQKAKNNDQIEKYHFNFLRNVLEKTATFLGFDKWEELLPKIADNSPDPFANRILNLSSHSAHAGEELAEVQENDKIKFIELIDFLETEYKFSNLIAPNVTI